MIPGHDPLVLERYPLLAGDEHGIACLHLPPLAVPVLCDSTST